MSDLRRYEVYLPVKEDATPAHGLYHGVEPQTDPSRVIIELSNQAVMALEKSGLLRDFSINEQTYPGIFPYVQQAGLSPELRN